MVAVVAVVATVPEVVAATDAAHSLHPLGRPRIRRPQPTARRQGGRCGRHVIKRKLGGEVEAIAKRGRVAAAPAATASKRGGHARQRRSCAAHGGRRVGRRRFRVDRDAVPAREVA